MKNLMMAVVVMATCLYAPHVRAYTTPGGENIPIGKIIIDTAILLGLDPIRTLSIAKCESGFNPKAYNPDGGAHSRGLFQISRKYHPYITDEMAYDPYFSIMWSLQQMSMGNEKLWSCARMI